MKKTIATIGATLILAGGGVVTDAQINPYEEKADRFEIVNESVLPEAGNEKITVSKTEPAVTLGKWDDEVAMKISYEKVDGVGDRKMLTDRVEWKDSKGKEELHAYPIEDGFEIEVILNEKPDTNVFNFKIEGAEDLDFFYQPELTQEEIDNGDSRPENVVGSYAVYHKNKANHKIGETNYATGKAYHIYRPKVIDSKDNEVWGFLGYSEGILSVTVPQDFLDNATYPVKVDPTVGYTSLGASNVQIGNGQFDQSQSVGETFNLPEAGTLDSIHLGLAKTGQSDGVDSFAALYREDSAGSGSHDLVVGIETINLTITTTPAFYTFTGSSESLSSDDYIITALVDAEDIIANETVVLYFDGSQPNINLYAEASTGAGGYATRKAEDPWTEVVAISTNLRSVYFTYTASEAGGSSPSVESDIVLFE